MGKNNEIQSPLTTRRLLGDIIIHILLVYIEVKMIISTICSDNYLTLEFAITTMVFIFLALNGLYSAKRMNFETTKSKKVLCYSSAIATIIYSVSTLTLVSLFLYKLIA